MSKEQPTSSTGEQPTVSNNADGSWTISYREVSVTVRQVVAIGQVDTADTSSFLQAAAASFKLLIDLAYELVDAAAGPSANA